MSTQIDDTQVLTALRAKQQQMWSSGDYNKIAAIAVGVNEVFPARVGAARRAWRPEAPRQATRPCSRPLLMARTGSRNRGVLHAGRRAHSCPVGAPDQSRLRARRPCGRGRCDDGPGPQAHRAGRCRDRGRPGRRRRPRRRAPAPVAGRMGSTRASRTTWALVGSRSARARWPCCSDTGAASRRPTGSAWTCTSARRSCRHPARTASTCSRSRARRIYARLPRRGPGSLPPSLLDFPAVLNPRLLDAAELVSAVLRAPEPMMRGYYRWPSPRHSSGSGC